MNRTTVKLLNGVVVNLSPVMIDVNNKLKLVVVMISETLDGFPSIECRLADGN